MSPRLAINFATRRWRVTPLAALLLVLTVAVAVAWFYLARDLTAQVARQEDELGTLRLRDARASTSRERLASSAELAGRARAVNEAIRRLNLPWNSMLSAVDTAMSADVALLALEPDAGAGLMRLTGEANSAEAMLRLQRRLSEQGSVASAFLTRHEVRTTSAGAPVRFWIEVRWVAQ
jgi:hypothetical protein